MITPESIVDETCTALNLTYKTLDVLNVLLFEAGDNEDTLVRCTIAQHTIDDQLDAVKKAIDELRGIKWNGETEKAHHVVAYSDFNDAYQKGVDVIRQMESLIGRFKSGDDFDEFWDVSRPVLEQGKNDLHELSEKVRNGQGNSDQPETGAEA